MQPAVRQPEPRPSLSDELKLAQLIIANLVQTMGGSYTITSDDLVASADKLSLDIHQSDAMPDLLIIKVTEKT